MKDKEKIIHRHLTSVQIIILGFFGVILIGSLLLMFPVSTADRQGANVSDALFTAVSAVCVTGLVVHDTATYWSEFGQGVILLLIQTGGIGVVTISVAAAAISGRKIGLMQRSTMQEAISAPQVGGIVRLTTFILKATILIEGVGALMLATVFCRQFGLFRGAWYAVFHSISAFCNAGFDLMGVREPFTSLTGYVMQPVINIVIMVLIIVGGIGFLTWDDICRNRWNFRKYRMQSKVILCVTGGLILIPAVYLFYGEFAELPLGERFLASLFQAVTPRTAGFNTTDLTKLSDTGKLFMILLMLVGGSPGSTAGGMKTTTLAVLALSAYAVFLRKEDTYVFGRRISNGAIRSAAAVLQIYLTLFLAGGVVIAWIEEIPILTALFETASAIGTVGLSLGLTPDLCMVSRGILILLMFLGRVGSLTLIFAALSEKRKNGARYPQEKITIG